MKVGMVKGMTAGALIGMAATIMMMPQMDMRTRRRINRTGKRMMHRATDMFDGIRDYMK